MKKVPILHKRWTEAIIVTLLVGILLTLFIPKFMGAQLTAKIAQAKIDTARVMNAVELLQQDFDTLVIYNVHFYNDIWGNTTEKVYFKNNLVNGTQKISDVNYEEMKQAFFNYLEEIPLQQFPVDNSQDSRETTYHLSVEGKVIYDDHVFHSGFVYEKSPYDYQAPGLMDVNLNDKFPSVTITHNKPDLVHTPGPVLLPVRPRNVVYNPTNGMISHGFIVHYKK